MYNVPLAYKFVIVVAMMSQVNYYASRLHLRIDVPVNERDFRFVNPDYPIAYKTLQNYGGRFQVKNYSFTFGTRSLAIYNLNARGLQSVGIPMGPRESFNSGLERASRMKYRVSDNDIYHIATNWLAAIDINVELLEQSNSLCINEDPMFHSNRGMVPSPLLVVDWKNTNNPNSFRTEVTVEISAVSGELLELREGNNLFSGRKPLLIGDFGKLLAISNEEFLKYSSLQRSNLLVQFAGIHYDDTNSFPMDFVTNSSAFPYAVRP